MAVTRTRSAKRKSARRKPRRRTLAKPGKPSKRTTRAKELAEAVTTVGDASSLLDAVSERLTIALAVSPTHKLSEYELAKYIFTGIGGPTWAVKLGICSEPSKFYRLVPSVVRILRNLVFAGRAWRTAILGPRKGVPYGDATVVDSAFRAFESTPHKTFLGAKRALQTRRLSGFGRSTSARTYLIQMAEDRLLDEGAALRLIATLRKHVRGKCFDAVVALAPATVEEVLDKRGRQLATRLPDSAKAVEAFHCALTGKPLRSLARNPFLDKLYERLGGPAKLYLTLARKVLSARVDGDSFATKLERKAIMHCIAALGGPASNTRVFRECSCGAGVDEYCDCAGR